jgi:hypothetical protein
MDMITHAISAIRVPRDSIDSLVLPSGLTNVEAVDPNNSPSVVTNKAVCITPFALTAFRKIPGIRLERIMVLYVCKFLGG